jgi:curved DNA-binding protein
MPFDFGDFATVDVGDYGSFDFSTIFGDLFGGGVGRAQRGRRGPVPRGGRDAEAEITVDLRDAVLGAERDLRVGDRTLRVRIPAGVGDGSAIRLAGQGGAGQHGGASGDLYLKVRLRDPPGVRREGKDIYVELPVTVPETALGAEVTMPTFEGPVRLTIPPGSQSGKQLRLRRKGLPDLRGGERGDLLAVLRIVLPEPSEALRSAVRPLAELYKDDPRAGISL